MLDEILALDLLMYIMINIVIVMSLYIGRGVNIGTYQWKIRLSMLAAIMTSVFECFWYHTNSYATGMIVVAGTAWFGTIAQCFYNNYLLCEVGIIRKDNKGDLIYWILLIPYIIFEFFSPFLKRIVTVSQDGSITYTGMSIILYLVGTLLVLVAVVSAIYVCHKEKNRDKKKYMDAKVVIEAAIFGYLLAIINKIVMPTFEFSMLCIALPSSYVYLRKVSENLSESRAKAAAVEAELNAAKKIQTQLIPHTFPAFPERSDFDIRAALYPCAEVGGDFYDYYMPDSDHLVLTMGDVTGHGMPAAIYMALCKSTIKNSYSSNLSAGEILELANNRICAENPTSSTFVTAWIAILELSSGKLECANAGHEMPVLWRNGQGFELFDDREHGMIMGVFPGQKYRSYELQLNSGDGIFMYTDGIPEAVNKNDDMLTLDGMINEMNRLGNVSGQNLIDGLGNAIERFEENAIQRDDITMLYLEYKGA